MKPSLILTVDIPDTPSVMLRKGCPEGIFLEMPEMLMTRGFDLNIHFNFDIKITVDLGIISVSAAALWILKHFRPSKMDINPRINGKQLPPNDSDAAKVIEDAIHQQKREDGEKNGVMPDE